MAWLSSNWIWILLLGFVAFHLFGHRHHRHGYSHDTIGDDGERRDVERPLPAHQSHGEVPDGAASAQAQDNSRLSGNEQHPHRRHGC